MRSYSCCSPSTLKACQVSSLVSLLKLVAEASRLKILCLLQDGEHCVCEIVPAVKLSQSLVSHHLKDLKLAGLVTDEKRGMYVYYSLTSQGQKVTKLLFQLEKP